MPDETALNDNTEKRLYHLSTCYPSFHHTTSSLPLVSLSFPYITNSFRHFAPAFHHTPSSFPHIIPAFLHITNSFQHICPASPHTTLSLPHVTPAFRHITPCFPRITYSFHTFAQPFPIQPRPFHALPIHSSTFAQPFTTQPRPFHAAPPFHTFPPPFPHTTLSFPHV